MMLRVLLMQGMACIVGMLLLATLVMMAVVMVPMLTMLVLVAVMPFAMMDKRRRGGRCRCGSRLPACAWTGWRATCHCDAPFSMFADSSTNQVMTPGFCLIAPDQHR
jgi:hypothetical protein